MPESLLQQYDAFLARCEAWNPADENHLELRKALHELEVWDYKKHGPPPSGHPILILKGEYKERRAKVPERLLRLQMLGPFVGDPDLLDWPHQNGRWKHLRESEARQFFALLESNGALVDDELRETLLVFFRARRRQTWKAAARAFAKLALTDDSLRQSLKELVLFCFPKGLPLPLQADLNGANKQRKDEDSKQELGSNVHLVRHTLYLACAWLALGGDAAFVPGIDLGKLSLAALPNDDVHGSLVLDCLLLGLNSPLYETQVLKGLAGHAKKRKAPEHLTLKAILELLPYLSEGPSEEHGLVLQNLLRTLQRPPLDKPSKAWGWLSLVNRVASLLRSPTAETTPTSKKFLEEALQAMKENAGDLAWVVEQSLALEYSKSKNPSKTREISFPEGIDKLVEHLSLFLDKSVLETTPSRRQVKPFVETLFLLEHDSFLRGLDWPTLLDRALRNPPDFPVLKGKVKEVALFNLTLVLANRGVEAQFLLHEMKHSEFLPKEQIVGSSSQTEKNKLDSYASSLQFLTTMKKGFLKKYNAQIGLNLELLIREEPDATQEVHLLWSILKSNPSEDVFQSLFDVLRRPLRFPLTEQEPKANLSPVHSLVQSLCELYSYYKSKQGFPEEEDTDFAIHGDFVESLLALCTALEEYVAFADISGETGPFKEAETSFRESLLWFQERCLGRSPEAWMLDLEDFLVGDPDRGLRGLRSWIRWLNHVPEHDPLEMESVCNDLRFSLQQCQSELPCLESSTYKECRHQVARLRALTRYLGRPEALLLQWQANQLNHWLQEQFLRARQARQLRQELEHAYDSGLEEFPTKVAEDSQQLELLSAGQLKQLNRYFQKHLLFREASLVQEFAKRTGPRDVEENHVHRVALTSNTEHLLPLFLGASVGAFFVLDIGDKWLDLLGSKAVVSAAFPNWIFVVVTILLALSSTVLLTFWDLHRQTNLRDSNQESPITPVSMLKRVLVPCGKAWLISCGVSLTVLLTTGEIVRLVLLGNWQKVCFTLLLWSSLSVFLGIFLQMILGSDTIQLTEDH